MQITYAPPADKGVSTLMYVGDHDGLGSSEPVAFLKNPMTFIGIGFIAYFLLKKKR